MPDQPVGPGREQRPLSGRFQVFTASAAAGSPLRWRLISENGRPLATSPGLFATYDEAAVDATAVRDWLAEGRFVLSIRDRSGWGWELVTGDGDPGTTRAHSTRRYARRVECQRAVGRFSDLVLVAAVGPRVLIFPSIHAAPGSA